MRHFFGFNIKNGVAFDPYYGMPEDLRAFVQYRFNSKDTQGFNLRNDGGNLYVVDYEDPISDKTVSQILTSKQPLYDEDGVFFETDDLLTLGAVGFVPLEVWVVADCEDGATFTDYRTFFMIHAEFGAYDTLYSGNVGSANLFAAPPNTRINNSPSTNFSPLATPKVISGEHVPETYTDHIMYIGGTGGVGGLAGCNGRIKDIICFNAVLNSTKKTEFYNYLATFHGL
jgi:hypothetical protein